MEAEQTHPSRAHPSRAHPSVALADGGGAHPSAHVWQVPQMLSSCPFHTHTLLLQVLVEAERLRPGLEGLLALADYVVTSAHYPQVPRGACSAVRPGLGLMSVCWLWRGAVGLTSAICLLSECAAGGCLAVEQGTFSRWSGSLYGVQVKILRQPTGSACEAF